MQIIYTTATEADIEPIRQLLNMNNLPHSDISESPVYFIVARKENSIVGCIGLEQYGKHGLLRSFAVLPGLQNQGIGRELYRNLLEYARRNQITSMHLLTQTAKDYFGRTGYRLASRDEAPEAIAGSAEFAGLCPASSTYMVLDPIS